MSSISCHIDEMLWIIKFDRYIPAANAFLMAANLSKSTDFFIMRLDNANAKTMAYSNTFKQTLNQT